MIRIVVCLIVVGASAADAAASPALTPPSTCGEVDVHALQSEQIDRLVQRVKKPTAAATKARRVCDKACAGGDRAACLKLGDLLAYAVGGPKNEQRAATLFTAGCDGGHAPSCLRLAFAYAFGHGVPEDHDRKLELFQKACDLGEKDACALVRAVEKSAADEEARQREVARMSPAERDGVTCTEPGPWTVSRQAICERACEGKQPRACRALSAVYEGGHGVKADAAKAIAYAQKACKLGDQQSCTAAQVLEENRRTGGRGIGILGALRAPPVRSPFNGDGGTGGSGGDVPAQPARARP
ncbi:MAG TPA: tetratricopeptide repeat protein [Polyangia bacterium]|nr:tetratricopeptide repeat protein [Polyangia bacterium]